MTESSLQQLVKGALYVLTENLTAPMISVLEMYFMFSSNSIAVGDQQGSAPRSCAVTKAGFICDST